MACLCNPEGKDKSSAIVEETTDVPQKSQFGSVSPPPGDFSTRAKMYTPMDAASDPFVLKRVVRIHNAQVHGIALHSTGEYFASASWDGTVKLYSLAQEKMMKSLGTFNRWKRYNTPVDDNQMQGLYAVAFAKTTPDLLGCVGAGRDPSPVYIWNYQKGELVGRLQGHEGEINGIDFHAQQHILATASDDHTARVWDFDHERELRALEEHDKEVYGVTFLGHQMEYFVATCSFDRLARVFDMRSRSVIAKLQLHQEDVIGIAFSDQKQVIATGSDDGHIGIFDVRTWGVLQNIDVKKHDSPQTEVKRVALDATGSCIAAACSTGNVLVFDIEKNPAQAIANLTGHDECCFDVAWATNQNGLKTLVSAAHDYTTRYWVERGV